MSIKSIQNVDLSANFDRAGPYEWNNSNNRALQAFQEFA